MESLDRNTYLELRNSDERLVILYHLYYMRVDNTKTVTFVEFKDSIIPNLVSIAHSKYNIHPHEYYEHLLSSACYYFDNYFNIIMISWTLENDLTAILFR